MVACGFLQRERSKSKEALILDPVADGSGHSEFGSDRIDDPALRRLFNALERHRPLRRHHHQLVSRGSHSRRSLQRYENLLVAAELDRLQHACLRRLTEGGRSEVESVLLAEVEQELEVHEQALERLRGRLPEIVRRRAEARARKRFEAIVAAVMAEVGGEVPARMILGESVPSEPSVRASTEEGSPESEREPKPEPAAEPVAEPSRCTALIRPGTRCRNQAAEGGLCELHARIAAAPVPAPAPEPTRDEAPPSRDRGSEGISADTAWAVGAFVLVAAILAWTGVPLGEDSPVGSRVVVGTAAAAPATAFESTTLALLHEASSDDARPSNGNARARGRDTGPAPESADAAVETAIPTDVNLDPDVNVDGSVPVAAPMPAPAPPAPDPSPAPDGGTDDGGAPGSPSLGGGGAGQASPVRGELVDEMLGRP
jgi:hypothetical protein